MDIKEYNNFLQSLDFLGMRLVRSNVNTNDVIFKALNEECELKHTITYEVDEIVHDEEHNHLVAAVSWRATAKYKKTKAFDVKAWYQLVYAGVDESVSDEIIQKFCNSTIKSTSYPYFRQFFAQACNDTCITLPPLPMLKLLPSLGVNHPKR